MTTFLRLTLASALVAACAGSDAYDEAWGADEIPAGKADGLLDEAEKLDFNEVGTGFVEDEQMDIYAIDLKGGDKITATMKRTSGDLAPHFTLYYGASRHIGSATFTRTTTKIGKTYTTDESICWLRGRLIAGAAVGQGSDGVARPAELDLVGLAVVDHGAGENRPHASAVADLQDGLPGARACTQRDLQCPVLPRQLAR